MKNEKLLGIIAWLIVGSATGIFCVNITKLDFPDFFVIDDESPNIVILDCKYEIQKGETNLVLKWQKDGAIIYQWIHGFKPIAFPRMKDQIDETYEASSDSMHRHRALALKNPSWNTTGNYKCLVQTEQSASYQMKHLQIIDASNYTLELEKYEVSDDVEVKCFAENVYPQPKLKIRLSDNENVHIKTEEFVRNDNGYFDVTVVGIVKKRDTDDNGFSCSMYIPNSNFSVAKTASVPGTSCIFTCSLSWIITCLLLVILHKRIFLITSFQHLC